MLNENDISNWFDHQDPQTKSMVVLCATVLLILLIIIFAFNPLAGTGITSLILIFERILRKGGKPNGGDKSSNGSN